MPLTFPVSAEALTGATLPALSGVNLTNLDASDLASGTVPTARLGSGTPDTTKYLRGDQSWQPVSVGVAWGAITGTLAAQTDLAAELAAKISELGVTYEALLANSDIGTGALQVAQGDHTHAQLHNRQHSVTDGADHTFPGGTSNFLRSDGTFAAPTASIAAPFKGTFATGSFTVETAKFALQGCRLELVTTNRATLEGTSRLIING